ncbi:glycosyltransferase [Desulfobacter curvatus]|uniref:glycosyltransferase n=1 Tax=Desulfobacter curvatus TaxID=2290 RepID=UPI000372B399|nr:glycosyltransferase [Desulfobacter curvatus]
MPKITHIFKTYFPETSGGLEEAIRQIGSYAVGRGFDVEVMAVGKRNCCYRSSDGIVARFFKCDIDVLASPFSFSFAQAFRKICRDADLLHFHFPWPTAEMLALGCRIDRPIVTTFHCDIFKNKFLKPLYLPIIRQYLKRVDTICVTSRQVAGSTAYLSEFKDKISEVPLFLNEKRFGGLGGPDSDIHGLVDHCRSYALFAGVLRWYKGLEVLLDAAEKIPHHIVIVGKGPLHAKIQGLIRKKKLSHVHLIGFQPDHNLKYLIENSRLMVLPSTTAAEAFGQVLLEGLYFSRPLVSTKLGTGTSVVNQHNHTGLEVKPGCPDELAHAINRIMDEDALFKKFSSNGFSHYAAHFTAKIQGDKYCRIYNDLLSR